ncbi:MAG TPA: FkbM family methyltransferase [Chitinophagaceae bacterium]
MKKIRRTVKRLLQIPYSKAEHDEISLQRVRTFAQFSDIAANDKELSFLYAKSHKLHARLWPHSDLMVLEQVMVREEYKTVTDFFKVNFPNEDVLNIVDAGANVGYSSVFFLNEFPKARIASIEPDEKNVVLLQRNLATFIDSQQARIFQNGLMSENGKNIVTSKDFRDGKDWSVRVEETEMETGLTSLSVAGIMQQVGWDSIDILKIDIEGAERFVFDAGADLDYLRLVKTLAIEIHDEFGIRELIYSQLKKHGFIIFNFAETTFGINRQFLLK